MAARKKTTNKRNTRSNSASRGRAQAAAVARPRLSGAANDIVGLLIAVIAIAMAVALSMPSQAPVTHMVGEALILLFGGGAILFPLALLLFALTFFAGDDEAISSRVAFGLALITVAVLSIVSITTPDAPQDLNVVLDHQILRVRGGYVGGGIAWGLLKTVGREVGVVVLVGAIIVGIVICGFSISNAVSRVRSGVDAARTSLHEAGEAHRARREERRAQRAAEREMQYAYDDSLPYEEYDPAAAYDEPATSFIGARTSSVLTRGRRAVADETADEQPIAVPATELRPKVGAAVTTLLGRARNSVAATLTDAQEQLSWDDYDAYDDDYDDVYDDTYRDAYDEEPVEEAVVAEPERSVPEFLNQTTRLERPKRTRKATRRQAKAPVAKKEVPVAVATPAPAEAQKVVDASVTVRTATSRPGDDDDSYTLPPFEMLSSNPQSSQSASSKAELDQTMAKLQGTLREFGLTSRVVDYVSGPLVTTFRVEMGEGERVNKIRNLEDDIALTLAAEKVRIFAPIAGTSFVGIEIPNKTRQNVHLGDVLPFAKGGPLEVAIGRDSAGKPVIADIAKMPHMLVAGTTGSGKSVMINSMIMSLLMRSTPKQVRLIMVDPKRVEFKGYNGIPHLYVPVVTEPRQAASALQWAVSEMERRLKVFEKAGARNITVYNTMCTSGKLAEMEHPPEPMPYLVIVIDELSDLMMVAGKDVEASIVRIAQLARAAGIHLVIATQRPSANVVTGLIKSNIDSRVALKVSSGIDSRVILDETGADRLLGNGDMLFKDRGLAPKRVLGCFTSDEEIEEVVEYIRDQAEPDYHEEILSAVVPGQPGASGPGAAEEDDPLVWEAAQIVVESQLGSTSGLQRRLKVGYARAGRIMDMLEAKGVVGPSAGAKPREVLLDEEGLEDLRVQEEKYREV